jgi:hypothetical protein
MPGLTGRGSSIGLRLVAGLALACVPVAAGGADSERRLWVPAGVDRGSAAGRGHVPGHADAGSGEALAAPRHRAAVAGRPGIARSPPSSATRCASSASRPTWSRIGAAELPEAEVSLRLVEPVPQELSLFEEGQVRDKDSPHDAFPAFHGYGASGSAAGQVISM